MRLTSRRSQKPWGGRVTSEPKSGSKRALVERSRAKMGSMVACSSGILPGQLRHDGLDAGREFYAVPWKDELQRRLHLWCTATHDLGVAQLAQHTGHRL